MEKNQGLGQPAGRLPAKADPEAERRRHSAAKPETPAYDKKTDGPNRPAE
ncbi:hypothetical protein [Paenibacillus humicola]|nr:hypothetical protein [Paenibacillus humicola]